MLIVGKIVNFGVSLCVPLLTLILYLQTPALTQETSRIVQKTDWMSDGVAFEMGDLYEQFNHLHDNPEMNVRRELWMLGNDSYTNFPNFQLYTNSTSLWYKESTQSLSYKIYNPMIGHGANITTFFDFTEHMNNFVFEYSLTYQMDFHGLKSSEDWSFCKNFKNSVCECFPLYLQPLEVGANCISRADLQKKLEYCLEVNAQGDCVMCKPGFMLMNLNVQKPYCSRKQYCGRDPTTGQETDHECLSCAMDHCVTCRSGFWKTKNS